MVNIFVPRSTFVESLIDLDYPKPGHPTSRLGKQRAETKQILNAVTGVTKGWQRTPMVLMWKGYPGALAQYGAICCRIWRLRGFQDSLLPWFEEMMERYPDNRKPWWWGDERVHLSHRSMLLQKDPDWYGPLYPDTPINLPYFWPVTKENYEQTRKSRRHVR